MLLSTVLVDGARLLARAAAVTNMYLRVVNLRLGMIHDALRTMKRNAKQLITKTIAPKCRENIFTNSQNRRLTINDSYS